MTHKAGHRPPRSWQEMREQEIKWLVERTGDGLETWNARVLETGIADEPALRAWLSDKGVTGYPQMLLVMERLGYPDYLEASADELIDGQYVDRPELRPILDTILAVLPNIGQVDVQARKTYVALLTPKRTMAAVQPATRTRVDLGIRLGPGQQPLDRLVRAPNFPQTSVTHKIALSSVADIDDFVIDWLRRGYEANT